MARKIAFEIAFQVDQVQADPEEALGLLLEQVKANETEISYTREILQGIAAHQSEIDALLSQLSQSWTLERMFAVDRVLLRVGSYEILYGNIPAAIAINEAVEMAKIYGDDHSPAFINAILDQVQKNVP